MSKKGPVSVKPSMSVIEMGCMLGLKKVESY